ncbi:hypothetical protein J0X19_18555 [Hymenobacter sp. BT186]|uniref:Uncharacterized protein n=1 Tax=Hymenobacter telluris TaxID=2816474 RepID=A0A939JEH7_9BACT|nr:hypothetical protein [Hymenobacter telluris]MBO0359968.1 hypothetical protein [Hymenobacter telluris]MBW3375995.1 hypothetical protein [Hymenobacter norwichensis]
MTNTLYLPRRHRRPLLFPPGLLALAWLLWLGCATLPQMQEPQQGVFQLTVDFKPFRDEMKPLPIQGAFVIPASYMSPLELATLRPWKNISFTGNLWSDYFSYQQVAAATLELKDNNYEDSGVRVFFNTPAHYRSLVYTLDKFNTADTLANRVHYWLDIRHQPTTIYAITSKPVERYPWHNYTAPLWNCIVDNNSISASTSDWHGRFQEWIHSLSDFTTYAPLFYPDWRNTTLLLLLLALLSVIRLYRQYRAS